MSAHVTNKVQNPAQCIRGKSQPAFTRMYDKPVPSRADHGRFRRAAQGLPAVPQREEHHGVPPQIRGRPNVQPDLLPQVPRRHEEGEGRGALLLSPLPSGSVPGSHGSVNPDQVQKGGCCAIRAPVLPCHQSDCTIGSQRSLSPTARRCCIEGRLYRNNNQCWSRAYKQPLPNRSSALG